MRSLLVSLSIVLLCPPARAGAPLDEAEHALRELRYEKADELLDAALRSGENGPRELARLYRLRGQLAASLGDEARAEDAFARWLVLDPDAALPAGTSPKLTGPFRAAAAGLAGARLRVEVAGDESAVTVEIVEDPLAMVSGARAAYRGRVDDAPAVEGEAQLVLAWREPGRLEVAVAAVDVHGNRLSEHAITVERVAPPAKPAPAPAKQPPRRVVPPPRDERPGFHQGWVWGGVALGLGVVGGYHGWQVVRGQRELDRLNQASDEHTYLEAKDTADRLRRDSRIANASFVLAGVCALTAVLLWPEEAPKRRRLSAQLGRDQAGLAMEWSW